MSKKAKFKDGMDIVIALQCGKGHQWMSAITGVDWVGTIFQDQFCDECGLKGKRMRFSSEDFSGRITDLVLDTLTPEEQAALSVLFIAVDMMQGKALFSTRSLASRIFDSEVNAEHYIARLVTAGLFKRVMAENPDVSGYSFGDNVGALVALSPDLVTPGGEIIAKEQAE